MKVYFVEMECHEEWVELMANAPYTEFSIVKVFASKEDAENWANINFVRYLNSIKGFCDFRINEKEVDELKIEDELTETVASTFFVSSNLDENMEVKSIDFTEVKEGDEDVFKEEYGSYDESMKRYHVYCMVPSDLKTRSQLVAYLKKRVGELVK